MPEPTAEWWRTYFGPGYLALYDDFLAERTSVEIDQLEALLQLRPPARILDLPCGQGRHAIELARRGYTVTGRDLSEYLLGVARDRARAAGVRVRWLSGDMREPIEGETFEVILNLYTSFGYFTDEADDRKVVAAAATMLGRGGRFVVEVINGERTIAHFQPREWFTIGAMAVIEHRQLDRGHWRMTVERTVTGPAGEETSVHAIRLYSGPEIQERLLAAGFSAVDLYGDWSGEPLTSESRRLLAVASKR